MIGYDDQKNTNDHSLTFTQKVKKTFWNSFDYMTEKGISFNNSYKKVRDYNKVGTINDIRSYWYIYFLLCKQYQFLEHYDSPYNEQLKKSITQKIIDCRQLQKNILNNPKYNEFLFGSPLYLFFTFESIVVSIETRLQYANTDCYSELLIRTKTKTSINIDFFEEVPELFLYVPLIFEINYYHELYKRFIMADALSFAKKCFKKMCLLVTELEESEKRMKAHCLKSTIVSVPLFDVVKFEMRDLQYNIFSSTSSKFSIHLYFDQILKNDYYKFYDLETDESKEVQNKAVGYVNNSLVEKLCLYYLLEDSYLYDDPYEVVEDWGKYRDDLQEQFENNPIVSQQNSQFLSIPNEDLYKQFF